MEFGALGFDSLGSIVRSSIGGCCLSRVGLSQSAEKIFYLVKVGVLFVFWVLFLFLNVVSGFV